MNNKNIIVALVILASGYILYSQFMGDSKIENNVVNNKLELTEGAFDKDLKIQPKLDNSLLHIAQMISPPSDQELITTWESEYTCTDSDKCSSFIFNARSYEDALWLKRKGYLTKSAVEMLSDLSKQDLWELSESGNVDAKNLLAINSLNNNNLNKARNFAMSSVAYASSNETFGYSLLAEVLLLDNDPMNATYYLRVASILGDTNATATYERITANSATSLIDNTNRMAYAYLLERLNTDINNLNSDPRPSGNGGG